MDIQARVHAANTKLETLFPEWWKNQNALYVGDTAALIAGAFIADEKNRPATAERLIRMAEERIDADIELLTQKGALNA